MAINLKKAGSDAPPPTEIPGRSDLQFWHRELAGALTEEREGIALVTRLRETIEAGTRAEASAVAGLFANGGQALANGGDLTSKIANGALAAKALPHAETKLATAQSEVTRLRAAVTEAARRQLVSEASIAIADYDAKADELCALYDRLVGIKASITGEHGHRPLEIPTFKMVPGAEMGLMRHGSVGEPRRSTLAVQANWTKALDRLIQSPGADLSDLIGG